MSFKVVVSDSIRPPPRFLGTLHSLQCAVSLMRHRFKHVSHCSLGQAQGLSVAPCLLHLRTSPVHSQMASANNRKHLLQDHLIHSQWSLVVQARHAADAPQAQTSFMSNSAAVREAATLAGLRGSLLLSSMRKDSCLIVAAAKPAQIHNNHILNIVMAETH